MLDLHIFSKINNIFPCANLNINHINPTINECNPQYPNKITDEVLNKNFEILKPSNT